MTTDIDTVLLKTASRCNLNCTYCYVYELGDDGWRDQPKRMSVDIIDAIVDQLGTLAKRQAKPFNVCLHGGEPLLIGAPRLERLLRGLRLGMPTSCSLAIQTNGLLLSDSIIDLLATYGVGVSISYDGPADVHDANRLDKRGAGSRARVLNAMRRLQAHPTASGLFSGVLAVVDPNSSPIAVYEDLASTGAPGIDFLYRDGNRTRLPPGKARAASTEYGQWMLRLLRAYIADPNPPRIRVLDDLMRLILGSDGRKEGLGLTDFGIIVIDTDGTITRNDTLKVAYHGADKFDKPPSILDRALDQFLVSSDMSDYRALQRPTSPICLSCPELNICGGGMPAHRWSEDSGYNNPTVFCADQQLLIAELRSLLSAAKAA